MQACRQQANKHASNKVSKQKNKQTETETNIQTKCKPGNKQKTNMQASKQANRHASMQACKHANSCNKQTHWQKKQVVFLWQIFWPISWLNRAFPKGAVSRCPALSPSKATEHKDVDRASGCFAGHTIYILTPLFSSRQSNSPSCLASSANRPIGPVQSHPNSMHWLSYSCQTFHLVNGILFGNSTVEHLLWKQSTQAMCSLLSFRSPRNNQPNSPTDTQTTQNKTNDEQKLLNNPRPQQQIGSRKCCEYDLAPYIAIKADHVSG